MNKPSAVIFIDAVKENYSWNDAQRTSGKCNHSNSFERLGTSSFFVFIVRVFILEIEEKICV